MIPEDVHRPTYHCFHFQSPHSAPGFTRLPPSCNSKYLGYILWRTNIVEIFNLLLAGEFAHHTNILISLWVSRINQEVRDHHKA
ncbi:uncharacterized protein EpC_32530 [Erwinia pyrifoliae Ep1/96]|nr:uncharacterized protein EpC_32530 [Erwinia pyrifoliae Ep1/96]